MEVFRTEVKAVDFPFKIQHQDQLVMLGSCFAENVGARLQKNKINTERRKNYPETNKKKASRAPRNGVLFCVILANSAIFHCVRTCVM